MQHLTDAETIGLKELHYHLLSYFSRSWSNTDYTDSKPLRSGFTAVVPAMMSCQDWRHYKATLVQPTSYYGCTSQAVLPSISLNICGRIQQRLQTRQGVSSCAPHDKSVRRKHMPTYGHVACLLIFYPCWLQQIDLKQRMRVFLMILWSVVHDTEAARTSDIDSHPDNGQVCHTYYNT